MRNNEDLFIKEMDFSPQSSFVSFAPPRIPAVCGPFAPPAFSLLSPPQSSFVLSPLPAFSCFPLSVGINNCLKRLQKLLRFRLKNISSFSSSVSSVKQPGPTCCFRASLYLSCMSSCCGVGWPLKPSRTSKTESNLAIKKGNVYNTHRDAHKKHCAVPLWHNHSETLNATWLTMGTGSPCFTITAHRIPIWLLIDLVHLIQVTWWYGNLLVTQLIISTYHDQL